MTHAYILIDTVPGKELELVAQLKTISYVTNAHFVTGPYDVIAFVEAEDLKQLGTIIIKDIQNTGMVIRTLTCVIVQ